MKDDEKIEKSYLDILSLVNKSESKNLLLKSKNSLSKDYISLLSNTQNKNKNELSVSSLNQLNFDYKLETSQIKFKKIKNQSDNKSNISHNSFSSEDSSSSSVKNQENVKNDVVDKIYDQLNQKLVRKISGKKFSHFSQKNTATNYRNHQSKTSSAFPIDLKINPHLKMNSMMNNNLERRKSLLRVRRSSYFIKKSLSAINPNQVVKFVKKSVDASEFGKYFKYLKWFDFIIAILVCANIVITLIDNEIYYSESDRYVKEYMKKNNLADVDDTIYEYTMTRVITTQENFLRFMNVILVVVIAIGIFWSYLLEVKLLRTENKLTENEGIWASGSLKFMAFEILFALVVYPPYLNDIVHGSMLGLSYAYNVNSLIAAFVLLKFYHILKIYTHISKWTSETARSICNKHNVRPGVHFAIKAELRNRPYQVLSLAMIIITIFFGFLLRTFEFYVNNDPKAIMKGENKLQQLSNAMWLCMITMTTVGYGDYFPQSHLGRFIGVVSCIIGLLLVSLIVVSLGQISAFDSQEEKAYFIIKKISAVDNAIEKARNVIITILRLRRALEERGKFKISTRFVIVTQLKNEISTFKNDYKLANSYAVPDDELFKLIRNNLKSNLSTLGDSLKKLNGLDKRLGNISENQAECLKVMEKVEDRQRKIGKFLVEFNNELFDRKMSNFNHKDENDQSNSVSYFTASSAIIKNQNKSNNIKTEKEMRNIIYGPNEENESFIQNSDR